MDKRTALSNSTFGKRTAEEEGELLSKYFVKTEQWGRLLAGDVDIVYGAKGSGKSALYMLLSREFEKLRVERRTVALLAENPRGTPAFKDLADNPPSSEEQFRQLWKLYLLILLGDYVRLNIAASKVKDADAEHAISVLVSSRLMRSERTSTLQAVLKTAFDYVRLRAPALEGSVKFDSNTGAPEVTAKVTLGEPTIQQETAGAVSADSIFRALTSYLERNNITV